jgi:hypothetical protein
MKENRSYRRSILRERELTSKGKRVSREVKGIYSLRERKVGE